MCIRDSFYAACSDAGESDETCDAEYLQCLEPQGGWDCTDFYAACSDAGESDETRDACLLYTSRCV